MNTSRIAKILGLAALSSLSLMSGASQADGWGFYVNNGFPPAPAFMPPAPHGKPGAWCPPQMAPPGGLLPVNAVQSDQRERIYQGIRSGQLTQREADALFREQSRIDKVEQRYLADGRLSRGEWADLNGRLQDASQDIYQQKHDRARYGYSYGHDRDHDHRGWN